MGKFQPGRATFQPGTAFRGGPRSSTNPSIVVAVPVDESRARKGVQVMPLLAPFCLSMTDRCCDQARLSSTPDMRFCSSHLLSNNIGILYLQVHYHQILFLFHVPGSRIGLAFSLADPTMMKRYEGSWLLDCLFGYKGVKNVCKEYGDGSF